MGRADFSGSAHIKNKREKIKEVQSTRNVTKYLIEYERQEVRTTRNITIYPKEF